MEYVYISGLQLPVYGLCVLAGIFLSAITILFRCTKSELGETYLTFLCSLVGLYVGAKLLYFVTIAPWLWEHRREIFADEELLAGLFSAGFVFYGGLIGALAGAAIYCKAMKLRFLSTLDSIIPCAAIGQAAGRIGCSIAGCCYGIPWDGPLAITYSPGSPGPSGIPLFPVQPLESALLLLVFIALMILGRRKEGFSTGLYLICSAVIRFFLEFFRGDAERGSLLGISTSQWIALILLPAGIILLVRAVSKKEHVKKAVPASK